MATGGPPPSEIISADDFRHCCNLCMEPYRGRCPKLLPCFHTFCLPCLTALANNAARSGTGEGDGEKVLKIVDTEEDAESGGEKKTEENEEGTEDKTEDDHHGDTFLCPTCRAPFVISEGGVTALQTNFYIDYEDDQGPLMCQMCEEGEEKEETHYCQQCEQRLCLTCKRYHDRVPSLKGHHVEEVVAKPVFQPSLKDKKKWCLYHPEQMVCIHCCECDVSMCTVCGMTAHSGHKTVDMVTAARQAKQQLTTVVTKADEQLVMINACLSRLERDTQDLHRQKQEITKQVNTRHELLTFWADNARDEALESLTAKAEASLGNITTAKNTACAAKATISRLRGRAEVKDLLGCEELVQLKSDLQTALLKDQLLTHFTQLADRKEQTTFFTFTADFSALDLDLLRLFVGDMVEGEKSLSTVKEMVAKIAALEAVQEREITSLKDKNAALEAALDDLKTVKVAALEAEMKDKDTKITTLAAEMKDIKDTKITTLEAEMKDKDTKITTLEAEMKDTDTKITTLEVEIKDKGTKITTIRAEMKDRNTKIIALETTVKGLTDKRQAPKVSFHAKMSGNTSFSNGKKLIFDSVECNDGHGYNKSDGVFTAPQGGTYLFLATVQGTGNGSNGKIIANLFVKGDVWAAIYCPHSSTMHATVSLAKGETVWVQSWCENCYCNGCLSFFSGALVA